MGRGYARLRKIQKAELQPFFRIQLYYMFRLIFFISSFLCFYVRETV